MRRRSSFHNEPMSEMPAGFVLDPRSPLKRQIYYHKNIPDLLLVYIEEVQGWRGTHESGLSLNNNKFSVTATTTKYHRDPQSAAKDLSEQLKKKADIAKALHRDLTRAASKLI